MNTVYVAYVTAFYVCEAWIVLDLLAADCKF